jgi:hypothetical protein
MNRGELSVLKNVPIALKILIGGIPILLGIIYVVVMENKIAENKRRFYSQGFSSIVLRNKNNIYTGRTTDFYFKNGLKISFWLSAKNTLLIGDSIQKGEYTYTYNIYRKDIEGVYKYYATRDFLRME